MPAMLKATSGRPAIPSDYADNPQPNASFGLDGNGQFTWHPSIATTASQTVWVSKGGNDATGDGTPSKPFLTIAAAQAHITDATVAKRYIVMIGAGVYTENVLLKPNVFLVGLQANICRIGGDVTLDPSWAGPANNRSGLDNLVVVGNTLIDFTGVGAPNGFIFGQFPFFLGTYTSIGDSAGNFTSFNSPFFGDAVAITGGQHEYIMSAADNFTPFTINGHVNGTVVFLDGGVMNGTGNIITGLGETVTLFNYGFEWNAAAGGLTLNGTGITISAQLGDLPTNIQYLNGATAPVNAEATLVFGFGSPIAINAGMNTFALDMTSRGVLDDGWALTSTLIDDNAELTTCVTSTAWALGVGTFKVFNPGAGFNTANSWDVSVLARKVQ